jgi:hypothetical protein
LFWSRHYIFAERECAQDIVAAFVSNPNSTLDASCIGDIEFDFETR